jgi:hypothetical protein
MSDSTLRIVYKLFSALTGGVGVFLLYNFGRLHASLLLPPAILFLGGAVLMLWLAKQFPDNRPLPHRNKTLFNRLLNVLLD